MAVQRPSRWLWLLAGSLLYVLCAIAFEYRVSLETESIVWMLSNAVLLTLLFQPSRDVNPPVYWRIVILIICFVAALLPLHHEIPDTKNLWLLMRFAYCVSGVMVFELALLLPPSRLAASRKYMVLRGLVLILGLALAAEPGLLHFSWASDFTAHPQRMAQLFQLIMFLIATIYRAKVYFETDTVLERVFRRWTAVSLAYGTVCLVGLRLLFWFKAEVPIAVILLECLSGVFAILAYQSVFWRPWQRRVQDAALWLLAGSALLPCVALFTIYLSRRDYPLLDLWTLVVLVFAGGSFLLLGVKRWIESRLKGRRAWLRQLALCLHRLDGVGSMPDLARVVLEGTSPSARRSSTPSILLTLDPLYCWELDAAGTPQRLPSRLPAVILDYISAEEREPLVTAALAKQIVRLPSRYSLLSALEEMGVLAVWPIVCADRYEGALLIVQEGTSRRLSLHEYELIQRVVQRCGQLLSLFAAQERLDKRVHEEIKHLNTLTDEAARLRHDRLQTEAFYRTTQINLAINPSKPHLIHYSTAMQATLDRLALVAESSECIALCAPYGCELVPLAHWRHQRGARAGHPFVHVDLTTVLQTDHLASLVGDLSTNSQGWCRLAGKGTLVLDGIAALHPDAQAMLVRAFAERLMQAMDGERYALNCQIVMLFYGQPDQIRRSATIQAGLKQWLTVNLVEVPSLRMRQDDLASLTLLAIDRACYAQGREALGIHPEALEKIKTYAWPGNLVELEFVIHQAVKRAEPPVIAVGDLIELSKGLFEEASQMESTAFSGSYAEQERKIFENALRKAKGNKSQAAKDLGLKRTTFLDKLRRYGMWDEAGKGASAEYFEA